jgi:endonuclease/exonuclease/phosphatase family metal-dependent hydrolase
MIKFFNESNSDIICLQEVLSFQSIKIGLLTKTHSSFAPNVANFISSYGLSIYSKYPIIESNHVSLTSKYEQRGFLHAVLKISEDKVLNVINVHLGLNEYERNIQISEILDYVNKLEGDTVVLGDFNQTNVSLETFIDIAQCHNLENTHSYSALNARIDYIFITNNQIYCSYYNVLEIDLSDHYPVLSKIK